MGTPVYVYVCMCEVRNQDLSEPKYVANAMQDYTHMVAVDPHTARLNFSGDLIQYSKTKQKQQHKYGGYYYHNGLSTVYIPERARAHLW